MTRSIGSPLLSLRSIRRHAAACARISLFGYHLNGNADELGLVPVSAQLPMQRANVILGPTVHKWHLDFADDDALDCHSCEGILYRA